MATWQDVRQLVAGLPESVEDSPEGRPRWSVRGKQFVWERRLRRRDQPGGPAPEGSVLAARVPDLGARDALMAEDPAVFFTITHFRGYPAVLVRLDAIGRAALEETVIEAWLARAPVRLARAYLETGRSPS